ncbi:MAG TPA: preprotein translocase subunit SecE [Armatimonadota bacterium]|nr:preprotein translocase subunit SecE [Armatimonadota bacterium]
MANTTGGKESIPQRINRFVRESVLELKKTSWPTYDELKKSTALVLAALAIITLWIGGLDYLFGAMTRHW